MKYVIVVDDSFISNFQCDDEDKLTLVMVDMNGESRAVRMKPLVTHVLTIPDGETLYLNEGHIDAILKYERKEVAKEYIKDFMKTFPIDPCKEDGI